MQIGWEPLGIGGTVRLVCDSLVAMVQSHATSTLLARVPALRLDGEPEWRGSFPLRELERLPVAWD